MRIVFFEGRQVTIDNLPGGFYLVKLRSHRFYAGPRVEREGIIGFIGRRNWQESDIEVSQANFPYASIYEPKKIKIIEEI